MCQAQIVRVELLGEMNELTAVVRILKQYDVLRIQTDRSHVSVFVEKVLYHENNRDVCLVLSVREQPSHPLVCLIHQVVVND